MNTFFFQQKFESKSNTELEEIAHNNVKYVLEARIAAITIMKTRNFFSVDIENVEKELENHKNLIKIEKIYKQNENENVLEVLNSITKTSKKYKLKNGNELQIRRFSKYKFQIKIEYFRSYLAPVVICSINNSQEIKFYPFINLETFITISIFIFAFLGYYYYQYEYFPKDTLFTTTYIFIFFLLIQIILLPFSYRTIIKTFKEEIKNRNVS
jgi:hypothetical protein